MNVFIETGKYCLVHVRMCKDTNFADSVFFCIFDFLNIVRQMMEDIKDNGQKAKESITKFFEALTEAGSRDDISLATVYHKD